MGGRIDKLKVVDVSSFSSFSADVLALYFSVDVLALGFGGGGGFVPLGCWRMENVWEWRAFIA